EPGAEPEIVALAVGCASALVRLDDERVQHPPVRGNEPEAGVLLEPLARGAHLLAARLDEADVAQPLRLGARGGGEAQAAARRRTHEPDEAVAAPVERRDEALQLWTCHGR